MTSSTQSLLATALATLLVGGTAYFILNWLYVSRQLRTMTFVERRTAEVEEGRHLQDAEKLSVRINRKLASSGYRGESSAVAVGAGLLYLATIVGLYAAGIHGPVAPIAALPVSLAVAFTVVVTIGARRRRVFNYQLKQLFDLLRGQLEAGFGTFRALEMIVPSLPDPLRSAFDTALRGARADRDLIGHLRKIEEDYPSKAFDLFLAALEIDEIQGGSLTRTLEKASAMLDQEFKLARRAQTELAQSKQTFGVVLGVIGFLVVVQVVNADAETMAAYRSLLGMMLLSVAFGNAGFGVFRVLRTLRSARGDF